MKLKNIASDVRKLISLGYVIYFLPGEIKDVEKPIYDDRAFSIVNTKNRKEKPEKDINKKEVNYNGSSK